MKKISLITNLKKVYVIIIML